MSREKPQGSDGELNGTETCWLRLVTGITEDHRRRIRMSDRDLLALIEACRMTCTLVAVAGTHNPIPRPKTYVKHTLNPDMLKEIEEKEERKNGSKTDK